MEMKERIGRRSGVKAQEQDQIGNNKSAIQRPARRIARLCSGAASEHHEQAVILSAVVPRTPGQIDCEDPRQNARPGMRQNQRQGNQRRNMYGEDAVFLEVFGPMVGTIDCCHVVRVVKEKRENVKDDRPGANTGSDREIRDQQ